MRSFLLQIQAIQKPHELPVGNGLRERVRGARPLEPAPLESAIVKPEAVMVPAQQLELISFFVAEDEPGFGEGIEIEGELHNGRKTVDRLAHVGRAAGDVNIARGRFG